LNKVLGTGTNLQTELSGVRILVRARDFSLLCKVKTSFGAPSASYSVHTALLSKGNSRQGVKGTTHLYPVPRIITSGAIPLLLLYAFMA